MDNNQTRFSQRVLSWLLSTLLVTQPLLPAVAATVTPTGNTKMDKAANGVPVVNIATPNQSGISHNKYNDYNVGKEGLILNNATGKLNQTQLGGIIQNNPNLKAGQEAKGIINEVTGANRSQLQGYTEVAGKAANVIVANPYGITCNGCGFINTPNVTLTTGKPVLDASGNLQSFDVTKGSITIEGQGLDGSLSDSVSILTRATDINAALHANDLTVIAGANRITADGRVSALKGEGEVPEVAVDTGALGGMYANRIRLTSTENGVGVNLGNLNARSGDITLDANGKLTVNNSLATGDISAKGQNVTLTGDHKAGGNLTVSSQSDIALSNGTLNTDNDLSLNASGKITQQNEKLMAGRDANLRANTLTQDSNSQTDAARSITLNASSSATTQGRTTAGQNLSIATGTLTHTGELVAGNALSLNAASQTLSGAINATGDITVQGQNLTTTVTSQMQGRNLTINTKQATLAGTQAAKNQLNITASERLSHSGKSSAEALNVSAPVLMNQGVMTATTLNTQSQTLTNSGLLLGDSTLLLNTQQLDNQQAGTLYSAGALNITAGQLTTAGTLQGENVTLTGTDWSHSGSLLATGDLVVNTGTLINTGDIMSQGSATLKMESTDNQGKLLSTGALNLSGTTLNNRATGTLLTAGDLNVTTKAINNQGQWQGKRVLIDAQSLDNSGVIQAAETLTANLTDRLTNSTGSKLISNGEMTLSALNLNNSGRMQADSLTLHSNGDMNNAEDGVLLSQNALNVSTAMLTNKGTLQGENLQVMADTFTNSGTVLGTTALTVKGDTVNNQTGGKLFSAGNLLLDSNTLTSAGQVVALGDTTLKLVSALTHSGTLAAGNLLSVTSQGAIASNGVMQGNGLMFSAGGAFTNNGQLDTGTANSTFNAQSILLGETGTLSANGDVQMTSRGDITVNSFLGAAGNLTMNAAGTLLNTALIYAGNDLSLFADKLHNIYGNILAGNSLWMQKNAAGAANTEIVNTSGNIETTRGDITMKTDHLLNTRDELKAVTTTNIISANKPSISVNIADMPNGSVGVNYKFKRFQWGSCGPNGSCIREEHYDYSYAPYSGFLKKEVLFSETGTSVTSKGGASRIYAARDISIAAGTLENQASNVLADRNITLEGTVLNNQSWQDSLVSEYRVYTFDGSAATGSMSDIMEPGGDVYVSLPANTVLTFILSGKDIQTENGQIYRSVIQAGGNVNATFTSDISNTSASASTGQISNAITTPSLAPLSQQAVSDVEHTQSLTDADTVAVNSPKWRDEVNDALQNLTGGDPLDNSGTSAYPLPSGNNGYFVTSTDPDSPYLITVNPKLDGLGQLDPSLYGDLYALLGMQPGDAPRETNSAFTDQNQFLGSSYFLDHLGLTPDNDYRFLGDAAFDTRYVSNYILNQTGSRYINGLGSDLDQMRYLMDNAAAAQDALGLQFGVALTAEQIAALDQSILWWESATINGQTVMIPKVYLSPKDIAVQNGSVISGNNVQLAGGTVINDGSTIAAQNALAIDSNNSLSNLNSGLLNAGGNLALSALGDINNISSAISGKALQLESVTGSINNVTRTELWDINAKGWLGNVHVSGTDVGPTASITAKDSLDLSAGKDINVTGASVAAGGDLTIAAEGNINVTANEIAENESRTRFRGKGDINNTSVSRQSSSITAGGDLAMQAGNDLNVAASNISAGDSAWLTAGNDLNLNAGTHRENHRKGKNESHATGVVRTTVSAGDDLTLAAGRDITSEAAGIAAESDVAIQAGRDVNFQAEATTKGNSSRSSNKTVINESVRQQGTEIASGGDTTIVAGRDISSEASSATTTGDIALSAGRDVTLTTATESDYHYKEEKKKSGGFLSKKTTHTIEEDSATREVGSLLSGDKVTVSAGNNLLVKGSAVAGDGDVALNGGNNVDIIAATNTNTTWRFKETKKSGLMGTGGIGFSIGSSKTTHNLREKGTTQSQSFSTVGSTGGSVAISAGNQTNIGGADVIAHEDLAVTGGNVLIEPGHDKRTRDERFEQKTSGLTVALSGMAGSAVNNVVSATQSAKNSSDSRLAALQGTKAILSGVQAGQAVALDQAKGGGDKSNNNTIGISASLGTQSSKSTSHMEQDSTTGSRLNAGNNVTITATDNDITIVGSEVKAGKDVTLDAARDVNLIASQDTQKTTGKNSSSGGSIGVAIGAGTGGTGISVSANVNSSKGHEKGNGTWQNETTVDAGHQVTINSDRDTTLAGAQVSGNQVTADVGRDLTITSTQDSDHYDSKQSSINGGVGYTFGAGTVQASVSASRDKMKSDYDSVQEQTGIFAGDGGFDVTVDSHTQLDGGVIASTGPADKNRLDTGTLGFSDIHNKADYKTEHQGAGFSTGGNIGKEFAGNMANTLLAGGGNSGHAEGTTQAAVSDGTIIIHDKANQKQDVADLSRDTEHANGSISPIFDKEKEQNRLQEIQLIGEIGSQAMDIAMTQGEIAKAKAMKDPAALAAAKDQLMKEGNSSPTAQEIADQAGRTAMQDYGTGSDLQRGIQAATAALQGLAGGNIAGALAGASAPELAYLIGHGMDIDDNEAAKAVAHAILGAVTAQLNGGNAAAGAAGAVTGELIAHQLFPNIPKDKLSEEQKQLVVALSTVASGLAGGIAGNSTAGALTGAQAGKNSAENNSLSGWENLPKGMTDTGRAATSWVKYAQDNNLSSEQAQAGLMDIVRGDLPESADIIKAILEYNPGSDTVMALLSAEDAKDYALALLSSIPAERALALVGNAANVIDNKILISAAEKISTAKGLQSATPRDLNEQILWKQVESNPANGIKFSDKGLNLNTDPRFPYSAGFEKMTATHELPNGSKIEIHYQYNSVTGKAYDMKIVSPQRTSGNPSDVIDSIKENVR
ncbi:hemagglutinin repeat-containing protein [Trabulsiella odontotermitis]|uniref:hemagglutinin repeat-containing protein n=1 Tax=Trabulsiella odontotermitis TaxID=379893 RepID=UPI0006763A96|nr:hemagglutinin repeat-containing protein [Trabulsiella odontotermitis]